MIKITSRTDVMAYGIAFCRSIHWSRKIKVGTLTLVNFALSAWIILLSGTRTRNEKSNTVLCRLRIGHTYATHGHLLRGEERPQYPCGNEPLTVAHVLLRCQRYAEKRRRILGCIPPTVTLRQLLGDDSRWIQNKQYVFLYL